MKESVGYTVTLNIIITFIIIVFAFLSAALIYFKSNKVSNIITETIEKYEGYNSYAINEINAKISSLGYNKKPVNCNSYYNRMDKAEKDKCSSFVNNRNLSALKNPINVSNVGLTDGKNGYCIFICREETDDEWYYYYKISTNMMINIPIINDVLDIPIFSNTNRLYDFECQDEKCEGVSKPKDNKPIEGGSTGCVRYGTCDVEESEI